MTTSLECKNVCTIRNYLIVAACRTCPKAISMSGTQKELI